MARPSKLDDAAIQAWLTTHASWERQGDSLARTFKFRDFGEAMAFVVRVAMLAERRDHHPDVELGWGRARIVWSTHDAGGITHLDLEQSEATEQLFG
jgi:4a-hydroxytetrahydrobiopterin dehydratase